MLRFFAIALACLTLAGCAGESIWASDEEVQRARYVHSGPPELTLVTSLNDRSGAGEHSAIIINASQRVLFDPAGTWRAPNLPERNDVRFGFTPLAEQHYIAFQAQPNFHAVIQRVRVSPEVAERALQLALANGAVAPAFCTAATSGLLRQLPGFESLSQTMFPKRLMDEFARVPGVVTRIDYGAPPTDPESRRLGPHAAAGG